MNYKRRRLATVDVGTNSLLLLVAERDESGKITVRRDELHTPRLGEGLRQTGAISDAALARACEALRDCRRIAAEETVEKMFVTATSAVREASNQEGVLASMNDAAGVAVEVITPNEEARLTYVSATAESGHEDPSLVVDIGGGSTEITWGLGPRFDGGRSLKFGTVKLLEGPLERNPTPTPAQLEATRREIDQYLTRVTPLNRLDHYYGTAGSFTHLAAIDLKLARYSSDAIHGHAFTAQSIGAWVDRLATLSPEAKLALPGVDPRRADLLLPGTLIIERLFKKFGNPSFTVIDRGIRYGKLFDQLRGFSGRVAFPAA